MTKDNCSTVTRAERARKLSPLPATTTTGNATHRDDDQPGNRRKKGRCIQFKSHNNNSNNSLSNSLTLPILHWKHFFLPAAASGSTQHLCTALFSIFSYTRSTEHLTLCFCSASFSYAVTLTHISLGFLIGTNLRVEVLYTCNTRLQCWRENSCVVRGFHCSLSLLGYFLICDISQRYYFASAGFCKAQQNLQWAPTTRTHLQERRGPRVRERICSCL